MMTKKIKFSLSLLAGLLTLLFSPQVNGPFQEKADAGFFNSDLEIFEEVLDLVSDKYVYPPDHKKLFKTAIEEMVKKADHKDLILSKVSDANTLRYKSKAMRYKLTYNKGHDWGQFQKVYYFLKDQTSIKISKEDLENAAIKGIIGSLDTYSQYMSRDSFQKSMRDTEGKYGGLGMIITMKDQQLFIVKTMNDSPASRAGILAKDSFKKVNGKNVYGMQIQELANLLRGHPDTEVRVTLLRPSENKERTYTLTREIILINTVEYKKLDGKVGYLKINSFSKQTEKQLQQALKKAKSDGVKGFILDLRENPGGLLSQSVKVSSHFLFKGRMVVYTQGRAEGDYHEYRGLYENSLYKMPVAIIVNQYSASASEIVAGALRDSGKALIIGENSYGKGSVQTIFRLSDGSGLRLTTSKYYTPSGVDITKHGIVPEILITNDIEGQLLQKKIYSGPVKPSLSLRVSKLNKFFEKEGVAIDEAHDAVIELSLRILKNTTIASKTKSMKKAREIAANIDY